MDCWFVCESIFYNLLEGLYLKFFIFCDIFRYNNDYNCFVLIMDVMKDIYDVVYNIFVIVSEEIFVMEEEKVVIFEIGYFNVEMGVMKLVVEFEKIRDFNKWFLRDFFFFKRVLCLLYMLVLSDGGWSSDDFVLINYGILVINICIFGYFFYEDCVKVLFKVVSKYNCIFELRIGKI